MSKERQDLSAEFRIGDNGTERERAETAAKLAVVMAERQHRPDDQSVEFKLGDVTPDSVREQTDQRMREIRGELDARSDEAFDDALWYEFSAGKPHISPSDVESIGSATLDFSTPGTDYPAGKAAGCPSKDVANPFQGK